ncbi:MAG TPA: nitroreductase family protein [Polyangiales bacterium]|nr:nitroreductase family protein [Polyangiales bacterium]
MATHELYDIMQTTRAVRRLRPDPVPEDVLQRVLQAATWGPSGGNRQPWRVIVVRELATKQTLQQLYSKLWTAYAAASRAKFASLPDALRARADKSLAAGDYLAEHFAEVPVLLTFVFDPGGLAITDAKLNRPSVVGGGSLYPAVQNALLACRAEGLGCVLTTLLCAEEPKLRELFALPEPWCFHAFVPIGYPVGRGHGPLSRRPVADMAFGEKWGQPL